MEKEAIITINSYDKTFKQYIENTKGICPLSELEIFLNYVGRGNKILDCGCGAGVAIKKLSENNNKVVGLDLSCKFLSYAKENNSNNFFIKGDMMNLPFGNNSFNGIVAIASLLHISKKNTPKVLREFNRTLKLNGFIYLALKEGKGEGWEKDLRYGGVRKYFSYFTEPEIKKFLYDSGFDSIDIKINKYNDKYRKQHPWMNIFAGKRA